LAKCSTTDNIARLAGVLRAIVSRILHFRPDVDEETRASVSRVFEEQSYIPSIAVSGLAGRRSRLVGILLPVFMWPIMGNFIRGITAIFQHTSYHPVLYIVNEEDMERGRSDIINHMMAAHLMSGVLALFPANHSAQLTELYQHGMPEVVIEDQQVQITHWVRRQWDQGSYQISRHLFRLGHCRIAHVLGPREYLVSHHRHRRYVHAREEAGIAPDPALVLEGVCLPQSSSLCTRQLFALPDEMCPTATYAAAD
jgi:LacI family transcriptional regulator